MLDDFNLALLSLALPLPLSLFYFQLARPSVNLTETIACFSRTKSIAFNVVRVRVDYLYHTYTQLNI